MSKPAGKCEFCGSQGQLTKSHIWPEWAQKIVPATASKYELKRGYSETYTPRAAGPEPLRRIISGAVAKRRPRNTCFKCNSGWMREIEETAKTSISRLMLAGPTVLETHQQRFIAAFLCLVTMRIELSVDGGRGIPAADHEHLIHYREPPLTWRIWIMTFASEGDDDYWYGYSPMAIHEHDLSKKIKKDSFRPEHCNSQVTTIVAGKLCAHTFSSTIWDEFRGYKGIEMAEVWPPSNFVMDTRFLPQIAPDNIPWLHEAISRDRDPPQSVMPD